ncbi:hypothetical protein QVD17_30198 [Tagetes erecta]|uniref:Uncharacterized protein n=1 Tax=Tagetes erecta TaxID=13708 RepID=A0AAD8NM15_TARER|nr:hypothetical protein QVD17_30198 [Tagetes erecta]
MVKSWFLWGRKALFTCGLPGIMCLIKVKLWCGLRRLKVGLGSFFVDAKKDTIRVSLYVLDELEGDLSDGGMLLFLGADLKFVSVNAVLFCFEHDDLSNRHTLLKHARDLVTTVSALAKSQTEERKIYFGDDNDENEREKTKTLDIELARAKVNANRMATMVSFKKRMATMVANEWKYAHDKVMPAKQWLEERRFFHVLWEISSGTFFSL